MGTEFVETAVLVVDEGFERADVDGGEPRTRFGVDQGRADRQERRLGLARSGRRRDQDVAGAREHRRDRRLLRGAEPPPALPPDPALDVRVEAAERLRAGRR
ncbi:hypothetical protein HerbRD11066_68180 [Herbidospora sp. RD11066]